MRHDGDDDRPRANGEAPASKKPRVDKAPASDERAAASKSDANKQSTRILELAPPLVQQPVFAQIMSVCAQPSGKWLAMSMNWGKFVTIVDSAMKEVHRISDVGGDHICFTDERLYVCHYASASTAWCPCVKSFDAASFDAVATYKEAKLYESPSESAPYAPYGCSPGEFVTPTHANGTLYVMGRWSPLGGIGDGVGKIVALDAQTLVKRFEFGEGVLRTSDVGGMTVGGEELYVGGHRRMHIFSLTGELLREIRGDWMRTTSSTIGLELLFHDGRLYSEYGRPKTMSFGMSFGRGGSEDDVGHILVLTPQGETLQVWKAPASTSVMSMTVFGGQLLVLLDRQIVTQRGTVQTMTTTRELIILNGL